MQKSLGINTTSNRLLGFLTRKDRMVLDPHLQRVSMAVRDTLEPANEPIKRIYFPEDGIASVVGTSAAMGHLEVGLIGKEGMTGLMVVLGNDQSPFKTFVQVAGSALVISADDLRRSMQDSPTIRELFLSYVQVYIILASHTAIANGAALLPQRLARWLLMCEDRLTSKKIPLTHEFLSVMLGVQRAGVTIAVNELESHGMIKAERGLITILDRAALIKLTNGAYGVAEAYYEKLFG
jgi:CRP-like cAMP-binding protein